MIKGIQRIEDLPIAHRISFHRSLLELGTLPSCLSCEASGYSRKLIEPAKYATTPDTACFQFNSIPPLEVLVCGCNAWVQACPF